MAQETFQIIHNNLFCLSASAGFTAWGYTFDPNLKYTVERPIGFWKAQLAFRGFSPRGNDVNALKKRLKATKMNTMDAGVERAFHLLLAEQKTAEASIKNRKRKADGEDESVRPENAKRILTQKELVKSAEQRIHDRYTAQAKLSKRVQKLINDRYMESGRGDGGEGSSKSAPTTGVKHATIETQTNPRKERVIDKRLVKKNPEKFLRDAFFDKYGKDAGWGPVELERLGSSERCQLHQAAESLRLYHETTVTSIMVIGSGKNMQGQQRMKELNRAAGWPPLPYQPDFDNEEEEESEDFSEEPSEAVDGNVNSDADNESSEKSEEEEDEQGWDITGSWEIKCPRMAGCFGQDAPYTLEIFSSQHRGGRQIYGRFDFGESAYKGVFRISSIEQEVIMPMPYNENDDEEFFLPNDIPSEENPTICYRWRGREGGENVIELGSENDLYQMTFSDGGRRVTGIWGCDGDPGMVQFRGVKVGDHGIYDDMNIKYEWGNLDEDAYNRENRDRWKRRY